MKKLIAYLLVAMMCLSSLAACGNEEKGNDDLQAAADYVYAMYKDAGSVTAKDFERTAQVMIGTTKYVVEWTTDNEAIKVTVADNIATIDVDEKSPEEVAYTLTATIKDADGNEVKKEFKYTVPKYEGLEKIVKDAYALEPGKSLDGTFTLEGVITKVDTAYSEKYKNVTVTIQVGNLKDMPIMCFRLKDGEGVNAAATIKAGDTITVTGTLKNYNGTIEFDAGCTLDKVVVGEGGSTQEPEKPVDKPTDTTPTTPAEIMAAAEKLADSEYLGGSADAKFQLSGVITEVVADSYNSKYGNMHFTMKVDGTEKTLYCYAVPCEETNQFKVGEKVTINGPIKNYKGTIEYDKPDLISRGGSGAATDKPADTDLDVPAGATEKEIVDLAFKLASGKQLTSEVTLTGKVKSVDSVQEYNGEWECKATIEVEGKEIYCYWLKGSKEAIEAIKVGDTIKVKGTIKNYNGTVEFDKPYLAN